MASEILEKFKKFPDNDVSIGPRGSRGWWPIEEAAGKILGTSEVSIGPRGSRGWWLSMFVDFRLSANRRMFQ